ncbi:hypothetical protein CSKR_102841 [Clonorchis sinensis]|uniref:Uncharacterized protein n=1 Tax=Clonorchis sinensis TaxID=79923 RepID=A0A8T1LYN6_CLOSI|nr:hypothetical protein CSKR_102841 [Clonorchis sinensis]
MKFTTLTDNKRPFEWPPRANYFGQLLLADMPEALLILGGFDLVDLKKGILLCTLFASSISSVFRVHQTSRSMRTLSFTWRRMMRRVESIAGFPAKKCLDKVGRVVPQTAVLALGNALDIFSHWPFISNTYRPANIRGAGSDSFV